MVSVLARDPFGGVERIRIFLTEDFGITPYDLCAVMAVKIAKAVPCRISGIGRTRNGLREARAMGGEESAPNRGSEWKIEMKLAKFCSAGPSPNQRQWNVERSSRGLNQEVLMYCARVGDQCRSWH